MPARDRADRLVRRRADLADSSVLVACRAGKLDGRPDLRAGLRGRPGAAGAQYWHCPAGFDISCVEPVAANRTGAAA